nr:1624_t:CDS:2 [Entrophospora candida]
MNDQNNQREVPFNEQPDTPSIPNEAYSGNDNFRSSIPINIIYNTPHQNTNGDNLNNNLLFIAVQLLTTATATAATVSKEAAIALLIINLVA